MKIPITKTEFTQQDINSVKEPLENGWVVQGPKVKDFENKWSDFTESPYSVAVTSCTTALHLSLVACGIGHGDEVIVPSFTWIATANAVEYTGAIPVFCDVDLGTFNMNSEELEKYMTDKTKAVIPVHLFGLSADLDNIIRITSDNDIKIIEDAACGFGSRYKGIHVGNFGKTGCFSFHPRKAITTGEGGMITTKSEEIYKYLLSLRDHGASVSDYSRHKSLKPYLLPEFSIAGYNYRMTDIQGALGSSQMDRADKIIKRRKEIAGIYDDELRSIDWLKIPEYGSDYVHGYQSYVCLFAPDKINLNNMENIHRLRNEFMDHLMQKGISTRPGTHAVHSLEYYMKKYSINVNQFPNSLISYKCSISLPIYPSLKENEITYIIDSIKEFSKNVRINRYF